MSRRNAISRRVMLVTAVVSFRHEMRVGPKRASVPSSDDVSAHRLTIYRLVFFQRRTGRLSREKGNGVIMKRITLDSVRFNIFRVRGKINSIVAFLLEKVNGARVDESSWDAAS